MTKIKNAICALLGGVLGGGAMLLAFPTVARLFVGPVQGEDQMSLNTLILIVGFPMCVILGVVVGLYVGRDKLK
ncbi:hypothetical protein FM069_09675 [Pseudomonas mangiferae]|uniref:Uncharacterized protein n=1 Tax=Pseudomonas mangiferae TaxID=2593654 RepID=A0A553GZ67_9PSED|nr:hypothetical protein FM069_09675 [Pseudomonas mangiferae]